MKALTKTHSTFVQGIQLPADVWWPLESPSFVRLANGEQGAFRVFLPDPPRLETIRPEISGATSLEDLRSVLSSGGFGDKIQDVADVTEDGGLQAKTLSLLLLKDYYRFHEEEMSGWGAELSLSIYTSIADAIEASSSPESLYRVLAASPLAHGPMRAHSLRLYFQGQDSSLPQVLGIRRQAAQIKKTIV
jgi:hypothetical protein